MEYGDPLKKYFYAYNMIEKLVLKFNSFDVLELLK